MLHTNICSFGQAQMKLTNEFKKINALDSYMKSFDKLTFKSPIYEYLAFQNLFGDKKEVSFPGLSGKDILLNTRIIENWKNGK